MRLLITLLLFICIPLLAQNTLTVVGTGHNSMTLVGTGNNTINISSIGGGGGGAPTPSILWLKTTEGSGTSTADSSGNSYNGTLASANWGTIGSVNALSFDGSTTYYVTLANSTAMLAGSSTSSTVMAATGNYFGGSGGEMDVILNYDETIPGIVAGDITFKYVDPSGNMLIAVTSSQSSSIYNGSLHQIVVTVNLTSNTVLFYLDGNNIATSYGTQGTPSPFTSGYNYGVGGLFVFGGINTDDFNGLLTHFDIFNTVLSQSLVTSLYNGGVIGN
jgi:hypothetical protein